MLQKTWWQAKSLFLLLAGALGGVSEAVWADCVTLGKSLLLSGLLTLSCLYKDASVRRTTSILKKMLEVMETIYIIHYPDL